MAHMQGNGFAAYSSDAARTESAAWPDCFEQYVEAADRTGLPTYAHAYGMDLFIAKRWRRVEARLASFARCKARYVAPRNAAAIERRERARGLLTRMGAVEVHLSDAPSWQGLRSSLYVIHRRSKQWIPQHLLSPSARSLVVQPEVLKHLREKYGDRDRVTRTLECEVRRKFPSPSRLQIDEWKRFLGFGQVFEGQPQILEALWSVVARREKVEHVARRMNVTPRTVHNWVNRGLDLLGGYLDAPRAARFRTLAT